MGGNPSLVVGEHSVLFPLWPTRNNQCSAGALARECVLLEAIIVLRDCSPATAHPTSC